MGSLTNLWLQESHPGDLDVSIVIPAFNEQDRLAVSLPWLVETVLGWSSAEIVLVDDGSTDKTAEVARRLLAPLPNAGVWRLPWNIGKGAAVRAGMAMARGQAIVFMDADLSADLSDLPRLIGALEHADVVVGSRTSPGAVVSQRSRRRSQMSSVFSWVVRSATGLAVEDTQCGFKAMRSPAARYLSQLCRTDGFAFDVEMLSLARKLGYRVLELPIQWTDSVDSRVSPLRDGTAMLKDILSIQWRLRRRQPAPDVFEALSRYQPPVAALPVLRPGESRPVPPVDARQPTGSRASRGNRRNGQDRRNGQNAHQTSTDPMFRGTYNRYLSTDDPIEYSSFLPR